MQPAGEACGGKEEGPIVLRVVCERSKADGSLLNRQTWPQAVGAVNVEGRVLSLQLTRREVKEFKLDNCTLHHSRVTSGLLGIRFVAKGFQLMLSGRPSDVCRLFSQILAATEGRRKRADAERYKKLQGVPSKRRRRSLFASQMAQGSKSADQDGSRGGPLGRLSAEAAAKLTGEQRRVCEAALQGHSIFFTGGAGTGKSFLLQQLIAALDPVGTAVTASTALAASQLGGLTLHKWAAVGRGEEDVVALARKLRGSREALQRWRRTRTLVIDEVSMVDGELFAKLEVLARAVRGSSQPFGGLQLVLTGDFLQLPPVIARNSSDSCREAPQTFCFEVAAWRRTVTRTFELTEVFRQKGDDTFCRILNEVRFGELSEESERLLKERLVACDGRGDRTVTRLMPLRSEVESVNARALADLPGELVQFHAIDEGDPDELDKLSGARRLVELGVGALVLLTRTIDVRRKLVNGSQGRVVRFAGAGRLRQPMVAFGDSGAEVAVALEGFEARSGSRVLGTRVQLPLELAWAVSVHKSQGMTLSSVEISLENVFEDGQAYVALSRARSLDGVFLLGTEQCLRRSVSANRRCLAFHRSLTAAAAAEQAAGAVERHVGDDDDDVE